MPIRIFTIPFDEATQTFHDDLLGQFCLNKRVHRIETKFFTRNHCPFWTVAIHYGQILELEKSVRSTGPDPEAGLDEQEKVLLLRLKEWRRTTAETAGFPVYLIATNAHLLAAIRHRCTTLESLKLIKGFGQSKVSKYGQPIINMIKSFYQPA